MKTLGPVRASAEQLPIASKNAVGAEIIRGAAGSGKTTTALLRLNSLRSFMSKRRRRMGLDGSLKVLLVTYNNTLKGYVEALARSQLEAVDDIEVATFAKWARGHLQNNNVDYDSSKALLRTLAGRFEGLDTDYLISEVNYVLGRFASNDIESYVTARRTGRGIMPRVESPLRRRILDEVVYPYREGLEAYGWSDWHSQALDMARLTSLGYDMIVVDESQDFSANQIRAIMHHLADDHAVTFVTDTMQRIYAGGYTWKEAGVEVEPGRSHRLRRNYRNTKQIAAFAAGILRGLPADEDGSLPDLDAAESEGKLPEVIIGSFRQQAEWAVDYIRNEVDLESETVAFLHRRGGGFFNYLRKFLQDRALEFVELSRRAEWPEGSVNIGLSTFHSAKGLEFDHVIIIGLSGDVTRYSEEDVSDQVRLERRLLAVAVARARKHIVIGCKAGEESQLVRFFEDNTVDAIVL